jgi:hypothetical protein
MLTGEPIEIVLTGLELDSKNEKTGAMVQAWILRQDGNPSMDLGDERERAVCGDCPLRGRGAQRICYVTYGVWVISKFRDRLPLVSVEDASCALRGKPVRLGAYGDPAAVPYSVWETLLLGVQQWTGYTHQWRTCAPQFKRLCMASVETERDADEASALGWRTFRIRPESGRLQKNEILCVNESRGVQCKDCRLCKGVSSTAGASIVITVHGNGVNEFHRRIDSAQLPLVIP